MVEAWNILRAAGLPDGGIRPVASAPAKVIVLGALTDVAARLHELSARDREVIFAWLRAYRQHWPTSYAEVLGHMGDHVLAALAHDPFDGNRYLKLRRIAIDNLARAV